MAYLGDFRLGDTLDFKFCTRQISGAPFTLAGSPVISAYPGNSTTELTAGITLSVDFDSRTGLNNVRVVATGGNGYATATNYELVITTGTVNSVSVVGEVVGTFSIENRSALMPTTAARTLVVDAAGLADATAVKLGPTGSGTALTARDVGASVLLSNGTGTGQLKLASGYVAVTWADIAAPTTSVNLSGTTVNLTNTVTTYTGNTPQTGDNFARIGAAGVGLTAVGLTGAQTFNNTGTWTGNIVGTLSTVTTYTGNTPQTGDNFARIGAAGAGLTAVALAVTPPTSAQIATAVLTTQMTESYATVHVAPTLAQAIFEVRGLLAEASVATTTLTIKKIDGSTVAETLTINSATAPTSITRTT